MSNTSETREYDFTPTGTEHRQSLEQIKAGLCSQKAGLQQQLQGINRQISGIDKLLKGSNQSRT